MRVHDHLAAWSKSGADRFAAEVIDRSELLGFFPELGRVVQDLGERSVRELVIREYRLCYVIGAEEIEILGIVHGSVDLRMDSDPDL